MEQLLLINPSRRKRAPKRRRAGRSAAQKAATRRMLAANRARRSPVASTRTKRRRRIAKARPVAGYFPNPRRRRSVVSRVRHAAKRRTYRRNPSSPSRVNIMGMLKGGFTGGLGAVAVNTAFNFLPLPAMMKTGNIAYVSKAALAIALGMFGRKLLPGSTAARMAEGSLAVTFHDAIVALAVPILPALRLGEVGYVGGGYAMDYMPNTSQAAPQLSEYINSGMGEYQNMGEYVNY